MMPARLPIALLSMRRRVLEPSSCLPSVTSEVAFSHPVGLITTGAALAMTLALFLVTHPYRGIVGDAQIYIGRALADIAPQTIGQDLMFLHDGQSRYSVFRWLAAAAVSLLSPGAASQLLTVAGLAIWFCGALWFVARLVPANALACLAFVCVLPAAYGPVLRVGESIAVPRPFAEGFVMLALAAVLARRAFLCGLFLALAALFQPIMAIAGFAALFVAHALARPKLWLVAAGLAAFGVALALLQVPLFDRLLIPMDGAWRAVVESRNAYLRPELWPSGAIALCVVQAVTILLAARHQPPPARRLLLAALAGGTAGLALSCAFDLAWPSVLGLQVQPWRMWWLATVVAAVSLAMIAQQSRSGESRLTLGLIILAWLLAEQAPLVAAALAALAVVIDRGLFPAPRETVARAALVVWALLVVLALVLAALKIRALWDVEHTLPADFTPPWLFWILTATQDLVLVLGAGALSFFAVRTFRMPVAGRGLFAAASLATACILWTDSTSYDRDIDRARPQKALAGIFGDRPGAILWFNATVEPWLWLDRPNWASVIQGAGLIFDRDLAMAYRDRVAPLAEAGLIKKSAQDGVSPNIWFPQPSRAFLDDVCARPDGPVGIVVPLRADADAPAAWNASLWTAPAARVEPLGGDVLVSRRFAAIPCLPRADAGRIDKSGSAR